MWVKTVELNWLQGVMVSTSGEPLIGPTRLVRLTSNIHHSKRALNLRAFLYKEGFYYEVCFGPRKKFLKNFSPWNGEIKPDIDCVRQMLRQRGHL